MLKQVSLTLLLLVSLCYGFESTCRKLQVSTDIKVQKDDIVKDGATLDHWNRNSPNPEIVSQSILLDYLYVTIEGSHNRLSEKNFHLDFDDHFFANSSFSMQDKYSKNGGFYTLEIKYKCKEYGGALIDYQLDINVPECGQAHIYWKKICGNPLVPREGFSVDVEYKQYNQSIVKNGVLVDASYFDADLDNFVFQVPANIHKTTFFMYMDLPKKSDEDQKSEFFKAIQPNDEDENVEDEADFQILEAILKMIPEVKISSPIVDADTSIVNPQITGQLADGGIVTDKPQSLTLTYNCAAKAETTIELSIPLDYFKDINLIFVKKCAAGRGGFFQSSEEGSSSFLWLISLLFIFEVVGTIYNVKTKGKSGVDAIPFAPTLVALLLKIGPIRRYFLGMGRQASRAERFPYKNADEEFETDFKIERKEPKYGSI